MPSAPLVFGNDARSSASSASFTRSATSTVSAKPESAAGSRSKSTQSGRSDLSTREYHVFMSMQPMLTIHSSASSSLTSGNSTHFFSRDFVRVETSALYLEIQSGMCDGASFWKKNLPVQPSG